VPEAFWQGVDRVRCPACESEFEQIRFPVLGTPRKISQAVEIASGEANCFFHAQNRAEVACEGCGRYVCSVCRVNFGGHDYCPTCLEARDDRRKLPDNRRVLYENIALLLALLPVIVWPFTIITAPAAIFMVVKAWKQPGSIVPRWRKVPLIIAATFAVIELAGWVYVIGRRII
jgi:hypothetical protein